MFLVGAYSDLGAFEKYCLKLGAYLRIGAYLSHGFLFES